MAIPSDFNSTPTTGAELQALSDYFEQNPKADVSVKDWVAAASHLFNTNPQEFVQWEKANPIWGIRFHAQADKGRTDLDYSGWKEFTGQEELDHDKRASGMAYMLTQQDPRYGQDGKVDGGTIAFNYRNWGDINNENGVGDFFKIGKHASFTDDIWTTLEDNPAMVAGIVAAVIAPWAAPAIAGATGLSTAAATGLLTGGSQLLAGADLGDAVLAGVGGYVAGGGLDNILSGFGIDPTSAIGQGISGIAGSTIGELSGGEAGTSGGGDGSEGNGILDTLLPIAAGAAGGLLGSDGNNNNNGSGKGGGFDGNYRKPQRTGEATFKPVDYGPLLPQQRMPGEAGLLADFLPQQPSQGAQPPIGGLGGGPPPSPQLAGGQTAGTFLGGLGGGMPQPPSGGLTNPAGGLSAQALLGGLGGAQQPAGGPTGLAGGLSANALLPPNPSGVYAGGNQNFDETQGSATFGGLLNVLKGRGII